MAILAGTSNSGLILRSLNDGISFSIYNTSIYGNPTCFCQLANGDIIYGTDTGYIVNLTTETQVSVSLNPVLSIICDDEIIVVGTIDNYSYYSDNNGITFEQGDNVIGNKYAITMHGGIPYYYTNNGIFKGSLGLVQAGNFTCVCDAGGGVIYAGDTSGHIWKSEDYGDTWSDLGAKSFEEKSINFILKSGSRFIIGADSISYTDNDFAVMTDVEDTGQNCLCAGVVDTNILLYGDESGDIYRSTDNGTTWEEISGNPQQGETSINALLVYDDMATTTLITTTYITTTGAPLTRGIVISQKLPNRITSTDLVPYVVFVVNPGVAETYEFTDMFINSTYKPSNVIVATDKNFTDPATVNASSIDMYNSGWWCIRNLPRTVANKVLVGKVLFVKIIFDNQDYFYDVKLVKTGYRAEVGG